MKSAQQYQMECFTSAKIIQVNEMTKHTTNGQCDPSKAFQYSCHTELDSLHFSKLFD